MKNLLLISLLLSICQCTLETIEPPVAHPDFTNDNCIAPCDMSFMANSNNATSYLWDFGDGKAKASEANPTHRFDTYGSYDVKLIVRNTNGGSTGYTTRVNVRRRTLPNDMVLVDGGSFIMGFQNSSTLPVHQVIVNGFRMSKYEITVAQWRAYTQSAGISMPGTPSFGWVENTPIVNVGWIDAVAYCNWRSQQEGLPKYYTISGQTVTINPTSNGYRLPTESEWEFAARGGNKAQGYLYAGSNDLNAVAWYQSNADARTHAIGQKLPNELGLYDMSGNVWEWCYDFHGNYPSTNVVNPTGPTSGVNRVVRGGSWYNPIDFLPTVVRLGYLPETRITDFGFRVVVSE